MGLKLWINQKCSFFKKKKKHPQRVRGRFWKLNFLFIPLSPGKLHKKCKAGQYLSCAQMNGTYNWFTERRDQPGLGVQGSAWNAADNHLCIRFFVFQACTNKHLAHVIAFDPETPAPPIIFPILIRAKFSLPVSQAPNGRLILAQRIRQLC